MSSHENHIFNIIFSGSLHLQPKRLDSSMKLKKILDSSALYVMSQTKVQAFVLRANELEHRRMWCSLCKISLT